MNLRKNNPKGIFTKARDEIPGKCTTTIAAPDKFNSEIDASTAPNEKKNLCKKNPKGIFTKARDEIPGKCTTTIVAPDKV